jgi:hypothetical protein
VSILSPAKGTRVEEGTLDLSVFAEDQNQPIKYIRVKINGQLLSRSDILNPQGNVTQDAQGLAVLGNQKRLEDLTFSVKLKPGQNRIEVLASNGYSTEGDTVEVFWYTEDMPPTLWIIAIGVNNYKDRKIQNLEWAVHDAKEIVDIFKAQKNRVYQDVKDLLLVSDYQNTTATRANIVDNFESFLKEVHQRDLVLLYISGHGVKKQTGYYFLPYDAAFGPDNTILPSQAISHRDIRMILEGPGKKIIFMDTCHSAAVTGRSINALNNSAMVDELQDYAVILSSSRDDEASLETAEYRHSLFAYAIIEGMKGKADAGRDGKITMKELMDYVSKTVREISGDKQNPYSPQTELVDFEIAKSRNY